MNKKRTLADRRLDWRMALVVAIKDTFATIRMAKGTHQELLDDLSRQVYNTPRYEQLTHADRSYLCGYADALRDELWKAMTWRLGPASGPEPEGGPRWTDELSQLSATPNALYGAHFWQGTDKPFDEYKALNPALPTEPPPVREPADDDAGGPNLDGMSVEDVRAFAQRHQRGREYLTLFPKGGKAARTATRRLANYAHNKAIAMDLRVRGRITDAQEYEKRCDEIYQALPAWARSW